MLVFCTCLYLLVDTDFFWKLSLPRFCFGWRKRTRNCPSMPRMNGLFWKGKMSIPKVQVSVKILQNFLYLKIKMFPTESNLCRFSTEWIIWKMLLKFTKKKPVGKSSQVKLEAHAQTCHCHEPTLKHVTAMGDSFTKFHGTFFYSEPLRMTISPIISYAFM